MSRSREIQFVWHRPLTFPEFGTVEPGQTITVDDETATRLLASRYFNEAASPAMTEETDDGSR